MKIEKRTFHEMNVESLYKLLALRTEIFVVEQQCAYQELDHADQNALHVLGFVDEELIACSRIVAPTKDYHQPSIGRVAVHKNHRGKGFGSQVFKVALEQALKKYPGYEIKIQAQCYLEEFYKSFGFKTITEPYPDFGIWHVDMIR